MDRLCNDMSKCLSIAQCQVNEANAEPEAHLRDPLKYGEGWHLLWRFEKPTLPLASLNALANVKGAPPSLRKAIRSSNVIQCHWRRHVAIKRAQGIRTQRNYERQRKAAISIQQKVSV